MEEGAKHLQVFVGSDGFSIWHDAFEQAFWHNVRLEIGRSIWKKIGTSQIELICGVLNHVGPQLAS